MPHDDERVLTFELHHRRHKIPADRRWLASRRPGTFGDMSPPAAAPPAPQPVVVARIEYNRWVADCPFCTGAELAGDDGVFFCCGCRNAEAQNRYLQVVFPADRAAIERDMRRREPGQRNWRLI